jgi:hypothetical protein
MQFGGYRVGPRSCGCGNIPDVTELCSWTHTLGYLLHGVLVKINNTSKLIFPLMFCYDFFFFGAGVGTQGLVHVRQVLYY